MNFEKARILMVENQLRPNKINDSNILSIFNEIEKEKFLNNNLMNLAYSDLDLNLIENRGYLKNLHIAQLLQHSNIKKEDNILHIGGLTGYVTLILSKLSNYVYVIENDKILFKELEHNLNRLKLNNVQIINHDFKLGYKEKSPYDIIFVDCPTKNFSNNILDQLNPNLGRLIMVEKIKDELSRGIRITKNTNSFNKEILFDVFSKFSLFEHKEEFKF